MLPFSCDRHNPMCSVYRRSKQTNIYHGQNVRQCSRLRHVNGLTKKSRDAGPPGQTPGSSTIIQWPGVPASVPASRLFLVRPHVNRVLGKSKEKLSFWFGKTSPNKYRTPTTAISPVIGGQLNNSAVILLTQNVIKAKKLLLLLLLWHQNAPKWAKNSQVNKHAPYVVLTNYSEPLQVIGQSRYWVMQYVNTSDGQNQTCILFDTR